MPQKPTQFEPLLRTLEEFQVEYILVGALSAVLQGAPISTFDVDIVHNREPDNVTRLVAALASMRAYYWEHINKRLVPEERILMLPGHNLLQTDFGNVDVLGTIGNNRSFEDLIGHTVVIEINPDLRIVALDLETLIETKKEAGREKDKAAMPVLLNTLAEQRRPQKAQP